MMWVTRHTGDRISKAMVDGEDSTEVTRLKTPQSREAVSKGGEGGWNRETGLGGGMGTAGSGWRRRLSTHFVTFHRSLSLQAVLSPHTLYMDI